MLKPYFKAIRGLLRIPTYLLMLLYYLLAVLAATAVATPDWSAGRWLMLACGAVVIAAWYINATAVNDLSDYEIDQINLRHDADRPLVTGEIGPRGLITIAVLAALVAVVAAWPLGWPAVGLTTVLVGLNAAYSLPPVAISRRGGWALALLPLGYIGLTMALGMVAGGAGLPGPVWGLIALCYVQFVARIS